MRYCFRTSRVLPCTGIILCIVLYSVNSLHAQTESPDMGYPDITTFTPKDWKGAPQCFSIIQDNRGVMYFGIGNGIVEYDGVSWNMVKHSAEILKTGRSMAKDRNGRIYVGGVGDLGYLNINDYGEAEVISLKDRIPETYRNFADVWQIHIRSGQVFFSCYNCLIRYSPELDSMDVLQLDGQSVCHLVQDTFYLGNISEEHNYPIIKDDDPFTEPDGELLRGLEAGIILPYDSTRILASHPTKGLFLYDGNSADKFSPYPQIFAELFNIQFAILVPDGSYVLSADGVGLFNLDREGKLVWRLDMDSGLGKNDAECAFVDQNGMLWVGMSGAISRIDLSSPISYYDSRMNLESWVISILHEDGKLYAGTEGGLLAFNDSTRNFTFVSGMISSQNYALLSTQEGILAGGGEGIFRIVGDHAVPVVQTPVYSNTVTDLKQSGYDSTIVISGTQKGADILKYIPGSGWQDAGSITGINYFVYRVAEESMDTWWTSNPWTGPVSRITFPNWPAMHDPEIQEFDEKSGVDANAIVFQFNGSIFGTRQERLVRYNREQNQFFPDSNIITEAGILGYGLNGEIWVQNASVAQNLKSESHSGPDTYTYHEIPFVPREGENIHCLYPELNNKIMWLGTTERLIRFDRRKASPIKFDVKPIIRLAKTKQDSLLAIFGMPVAIPHAGNRLRFEYALPFYYQEDRTQYSVWMEGLDETWSEWNQETYKEFMNLPAGDYTFHLKAKNVFEKESGECTYAFTILPPWWQTWWAYGIYVLCGIALLILVDKLQRNRLMKKEREKNRDKELAQAREIEKAYAELETSHEHLKSTQAQLIQSEKMASLGEMTAGIAHEIQNPLNFVNNFAEVNKELTEEIKEAIRSGNYQEAIALASDLGDNEDKITHHGKRADSIVKSMLQHSRGSSGQKELVDINSLCNEYLRLSYHGLRAKDKTFNANFKADLDPTLPMVNVIPQDIGRVLLNLINNAFYAVTERKNQSGDGYTYTPEVTLATSKSGNQVQITIRDNGKGIPKSALDKVFQPFFTTKPAGSGTGLGLSISYDIIRAHGGELKVDSTEGIGTSMILILPL